MWKKTVQRGRPRKIKWRMRIVCWIPTATNTHTLVVQYSLLFHFDNGYTKAPQIYVIHTLPVLFFPRYTPA